jgi:hypothetical protein
MIRLVLATTTILGLGAFPALAVPATQAGADRITQTLQTYLGSTAEVVGVTAQGDTYLLKLNAAPLMPQNGGQGVVGQISVISLTLTDNGDGTWGVAMDQPFAVKAGVKDVFDLQESVAGWTLTGTFDEKLLSFSTVTSQFSGLKLEETIQQPGQPATYVLVTMDSAGLQSTSVANPAGGSDTAMTATIVGLSEKFNMPAIDGSTMSMPVEAKLDSLTEKATVTGLRLDTMAPVLAWVVAHPDGADQDAARSELKPLLQAALPIFATASAHGDSGPLTVTTPMGAITADKVAFLLDANGVVPDGKFREGVSLSGLTLPPGLVPDWAMALVPKDASLDVQVSDYDAAAAAAQALTAFDLPAGQDPAPGFGDMVLAALMPHQTVTVTLNPGTTNGAGYSLAYEGSLVAGPGTDVPSFKAKLTVTGFDAILDALKTAPEEMRLQATMGLGAMRGLANPGDNGALVWEVDGTKPGQVLVNGMDMSKLGGGN